MYIARTGQASKAAVYSTLHATWTIIIGIVNREYVGYIYIYLAFVYIGYSLINYDKKKAAEKAKKAKVRVRFLRRVENDYDTEVHGSLLAVEKELQGDSNLVNDIEDELRATVDVNDVHDFKFKGYTPSSKQKDPQVRLNNLGVDDLLDNPSRPKNETQYYTPGINEVAEDNENDSEDSFLRRANTDKEK